MASKKTSPREQPAAPKKTKDAPAAAASGSALDAVTLDSLAAELGPADPALAERSFANVEGEALVDEGTSVDSLSLIDDVPRFVGSAREILGALSSAQRGKVRMPAGILALLVSETVKLRDMKQAHDAAVTGAAGSKAERGATARKVLRDGIGERDLCYEGLRSALDERKMAAANAIVGRADSHDNLAKGLEALASFIRDTAKKSDADKSRLEDYGVGPDRADALDALAAEVREAGKVTTTPGRRVSQRSLDSQDGRVLLLVERILRAFRAARRVDPAILVPPLSRVAWKFEVRSGSRGPAGGTSSPAEDGDSTPA
ncbi:MAG TPA: hypothetical protein VLS89_09595 [Candidatus Nanopelagicales bacterium]|nr:hypothetical protein [Candidatus Nanopelagicales bacterium]